MKSRDLTPDEMVAAAMLCTPGAIVRIDPPAVCFRCATRTYPTPVTQHGGGYLFEEHPCRKCGQRGFAYLVWSSSREGTE